MSSGGLRSIPNNSASKRSRRNPVAWIVWGMILALLATIYNFKHVTSLQKRALRSVVCTRKEVVSVN